MADIVTDDYLIYYLSECALTVWFGNEINEASLLKVESLNALLCEFPFHGLVETVPAYTTLSVFYDAFTVNANNDMPGERCFDSVSAYISRLLKQGIAKANAEGDVIDIPVCYGDVYGPDLKDVAALNGLGMDEVIRLHRDADYRVGMIGFLPGFAYLTGLDKAIAAPRKSSPRKLVPAGSVGIAGNQTGIYPLNSPGGWQIIGRTPLTLFDACGTPTTLLKAGDIVTFCSISAEEFEDLTHSGYADKYC